MRHGGNHAHHSARRTFGSLSWIATLVAVQPRMGLLPQRRVGTRCGGARGSPATGKNLTRDSLEVCVAGTT